MTSISPLIALIRLLPKRRQQQLVAAIALILVGAICEAAAIGAVVPLLAFLTGASIPHLGILKELVDTLTRTNAVSLSFIVTFVFIAAAVASGVTRLALTWVLAKLNAAVAYDIGTQVFRRSIRQPYHVHVARNSSEILAALDKVDRVVWVLFGVLNLISSSIMAAFIFVTLIAIDPYVTAIALCGLASIYCIVGLLSRRTLASNSKTINEIACARIQCVQETLGGIRDVSLGQSYSVFERQFSEQDKKLRNAQASNNFIGPAPRFAVEALAMVLLASVAYTFTETGSGITSALPALSALTLGLQRLAPMIQQIYQGAVLMRGNSDALCDIVRLLHQPLPPFSAVGERSLPFHKAVSFENVSFRYAPGGASVLSGVNLTLSKGQRVGIIGPTGSGKTTVVDLLMGLLEPTDGEIKVDGVPLRDSDRLAWQRNIAHVPQSVFLSDASIAENIAFGIPLKSLDIDRVKRVACQAQIADFVERQPNQLWTPVGERGIRLSGGQRQRIGIARALYKGATVLVFDEATSALDNDTELAVMDAVHALGRDITIVMIAHRLGTLQECDVVFRLEKGCIVTSGSYDEIVRQNAAAA